MDRTCETTAAPQSSRVLRRSCSPRRECGTRTLSAMDCGSPREETEKPRQSDINPNTIWATLVKKEAIGTTVAQTKQSNPDSDGTTFEPSGDAWNVPRLELESHHSKCIKTSGTRGLEFVCTLAYEEERSAAEFAGILRVMAAEEWVNSLQLHLASHDLNEAFDGATPRMLWRASTSSTLLHPTGAVAGQREQLSGQNCLPKLERRKRRLRYIDQGERHGVPDAVQFGGETLDETVGGKMGGGGQTDRGGGGGGKNRGCSFKDCHGQRGRGERGERGGRGMQTEGTHGALGVALHSVLPTRHGWRSVWESVSCPTYTQHEPSRAVSVSEEQVRLELRHVDQGHPALCVADYAGALQELNGPLCLTPLDPRVPRSSTSTSMTREQDRPTGLGQTLRTRRPLVGGFSDHDVSVLCTSTQAHRMPGGIQPRVEAPRMLEALGGRTTACQCSPDPTLSPASCGPAGA